MDESSNPGSVIDAHQQKHASDAYDFSLRLIDAVRKNPCLYDASDKQYRQSDYKIKVWNRLVQVLRFDGDARTLYGRWKQLRDKYGKEKKKIKYMNEPSQWQYLNYLEFLEPHMVDRTSRFDNSKEGTSVVITDPNFSPNLISEVKLQSCLFDVKDAKYRSMEYRAAAWNQIIENLNFPGDVSSIYKQWKKIRDRYVREKRKLRMSGGGDHDESAWELFDQMRSQVRRKRDASETSGGQDDFYLDEPTVTFATSAERNSFEPAQQYSTIIQTCNSERPQMSVNNLQQLVRLHGNTTNNLRGVAVLQHPLPISLANENASGPLLATPTTQPQHPLLISSTTGDGDAAFAISYLIFLRNDNNSWWFSVAADLLSLPERDRNMARAQIQHLIKNSKITILKA